MLQESIYIERFLLTKKKHNRKQQSLINSAATIPETPRILCNDRSGVDEKSERRCKGGGISGLGIVNEIENDRKINLGDGGTSSSMIDQAFANCIPNQNILISNQEGAKLPFLKESVPEVHDKSHLECLGHMDHLKDVQ